ncbi:MAG: DUF1684 domain-containing protein, partial [Cyclobacteriaceae bacterium]
MKKRNLILLSLLGIAVLVIVIYGFDTAQDPVAYAELISEERKKTERFLLYSEDSPLGDKEIEDFSGLNYFEADIAYKVRAKVEPLGGNQEVLLTTSDGQEASYRKFGYA